MSHKKAMASIIMWAGLAAVPSAQTITVTAPNGGENWTIGRTSTILWSSSGVTSVRIVLFRGGTAAAHRIGNIAEGLPAASGSYTWVVGATSGGTAAAGGDYYIRVRSESDATADTSAAPFTLVSPLPNIHVGSMRDIGWSYTFLPAAFTAGDTVTIKYHLTNDSAYPAGAFSVGLRVGGTIIARNPHPGLESGGEDNGEFTWTATCGSPLAVVADCDGAVAESNESDNVFSDPGLACSSGHEKAKAGLPYEFSAQIDAERARADDMRGAAGALHDYKVTAPMSPSASPGCRRRPLATNRFRSTPPWAPACWASASPTAFPPTTSPRRR